MSRKQNSNPRRSLLKANTRFTRAGALLMLLMSPFFEEKIGFQGQIELIRVATVRAKYLENEIFPGQGKVWIFGKFRKDLESQGKVSEFENK